MSVSLVASIFTAIAQLALGIGVIVLVSLPSIRQQKNVASQEHEDAVDRETADRNEALLTAVQGLSNDRLNEINRLNVRADRLEQLHKQCEVDKEKQQRQIDDLYRRLYNRDNPNRQQMTTNTDS